MIFTDKEIPQKRYIRSTSQTNCSIRRAKSTGKGQSRTRPRFARRPSNQITLRHHPSLAPFCLHPYAILAMPSGHQRLKNRRDTNSFEFTVIQPLTASERIIIFFIMITFLVVFTIGIHHLSTAAAGWPRECVVGNVVFSEPTVLDSIHFAPNGGWLACSRPWVE